jgi:hypothetical protein
MTAATPFAINISFGSDNAVQVEFIFYNVFDGQRQCGLSLVKVRVKFVTHSSKVYYEPLLIQYINPAQAKSIRLIARQWNGFTGRMVRFVNWGFSSRNGKLHMFRLLFA